MMNEYCRKSGDDRLPQKLMVHDLVLSDFIFKAIDLENQLKQVNKSSGLFVKAVTDICDKETVRKIIDHHFKLMQLDNL
jgi:hypothetical protein